MGDFNVEITLRTQMCGDNHHYAVPATAIFRAVCPLCAWNKRNAANEHEERLARQVAALKGQITKMRRRHAR